MKDFLKIKLKLYQTCLLFVEERRNTITHSIESNKEALFSESKSLQEIDTKREEQCCS